MPSEHVPTVVADDDDVADDDLEPSTVTGIHDTEQYVHEPPITESQILPFADPSSHCSPPSIFPLPHTGFPTETDEADDVVVPVTTTVVHTNEQYVHDVPVGAMHGWPFIAPKSHCSVLSTTALPHTAAEADEIGADDDIVELELADTTTDVKRTASATTTAPWVASFTTITPPFDVTVAPCFQFDVNDASSSWEEAGSMTKFVSAFTPSVTVYACLETRSATGTDTSIWYVPGATTNIHSAVPFVLNRTASLYPNRMRGIDVQLPVVRKMPRSVSSMIAADGDCALE